MKLQTAVVDETYKVVFGTNTEWTPPFEADSIYHPRCARNDWAAAQLLLFSDKEMMVTISDAPCFYKKYPIPVLRVKARCDTLPPQALRVNLVGLVKDDDGQWRADALLHEEEIHVEHHQAQPVWLQLDIPADAPVGRHTVTVSIYESLIFSDEEKIKELSVEVEILPAVLRGCDKSAFTLDLWQHNSAIARAYAVPLWGDEHFAILETYVEALAEIGQKAITVVASEVPWTGQWSNYNRVSSSNTYEFNMARITRRADGTFSYDFSAMERYIRLCMRAGIQDEIEVFGLMNVWKNEDVGYGGVIEDYPDAIRLRYYNEADGTYQYVRRRETLFAYLRALEQVFVANGWADKVRVLCDEPSDLELFKKTLSMLREAAPAFRFKTAINHIEFINEEIEGLWDYVPGLPCVTQGYGRLCEIRDKVPGKISFYVCCGPDHPNTFLRSPLIEGRLIPWLAWYLGFDGFLRWNFTVWPDDAFSPQGYYHQTHPAGDIVFVYPGRDRSPVYTLRYMCLKRGIRDTEIFRAYAEKYGREETLARIKRVFRFSSIAQLDENKHGVAQEQYELENSAYDAVIEEMLRAL